MHATVYPKYYKGGSQMKMCKSTLLPVLLVCIFLIIPAFAQQDTDLDGILDDVDNCVEVPNGPDLGTCVETVSDMISGTWTTCENDGDCGPTETCDMAQGDMNANGKGDACECYADSDCDSKINLSDLVLMKKEFQRGDCATEFCYANANGDGKVDLKDLVVMKAQFTKPDCSSCTRPVGVIFAIHGGMDSYQDQHMWDASVHQFSYDPNHSVYKLVIWNPIYWPLMLDPSFTDFAARFIRMYAFEYDRIGGIDPFHTISEQQLQDMKDELDANTHGITFEVDWAGYMAADRVEHYAYPRFIYYGPDGPGTGSNCTYCGEGEPGGPWEGCDPERYNLKGPVERLLNKGAYRIIMVDWTMGGPRFSKTYDVVEMTKRALHDWNTAHGTSIPDPLWVNDYSNLMERSYPVEPEGWTRVLRDPTVDSHVLLNGSPNPIVTDPVVTDLNVEALEAAFSSTVSDADTGIILFNHALHDYNEWFDPKINDTLIINRNIKTELFNRHPSMDPDNIVGAFGGIQDVNPENGLEERNREMRGESYGHAWLYQTDKVLPGGEWGYRYWDALEYLKNRGVGHIVIAFPQVVTDNVLNMVEIYNQIAGREIGYKNWAKWGSGDYLRYPGAGHPFADYWGNWVNTDCSEWVLSYDSGTSIFHAGATLTGQASGATAVIKWVDGDAVSGTLALKQLSGTFSDNETIHDNKNPAGSALANGVETQTSKPECCFAMGGCGDPLMPYPPVRQTAINLAMSDLDPTLCFDVSAYGHLGYDPAVGPPDPDNPVQDQYTGTWEVYIPPNDDPRVGQMLASYVIDAIVKPMVYLTNGEIASIEEGESVTFVSHVTGGKPAYSYQWFIKEGSDPGWTAVGGNSASWLWNTGSGDAGTYAIRCVVTESQSVTGEVIWEGFVVASI